MLYLDEASLLALLDFLSILCLSFCFFFFLVVTALFIAFVSLRPNRGCHYVLGGIPDTSREVTRETHLRLRGYLEGGFPVTYWEAIRVEGEGWQG